MNRSLASVMAPRSQRGCRRLLGLALAATTFASGFGGGCSGVVGEPDGAAGLSRPGLSPVRRLTPREYNNAVRDLLGLNTAPMREGEAVMPSGFDSDAERFSITPNLVEDFLLTAETLAAKTDLGGLFSCEPTWGHRLCAERFTESVGLRVLRRPLDSLELEAYLALYATVAADEDHATALRAILTRMLVAPDFLYHVERGDPREPSPSGAHRLTPFELASRLSFLLWQSVPDQELLRAAQDGRLASKEEVLAQTRRMIADPRTQETLWHFHQQWLELGRLNRAHKDESIYPGFEQMKADLVEGVRAFVGEIIDRGEGLHHLLTTPVVYLSPRAAPLYGVSPQGEGFMRLEPGETKAFGVLTQPAVLASLGKASGSAPILRGVFLRDRLLCQPVPPPPPGATVIPPDTAPAATTREFYARLTSGPSCIQCHEGINPLGFAFEHFDGIGRWRAQDNGHPVDASGTTTLDNRPSPFTDAADLAEVMSQSDQVALCFARQWFRFAYRRRDQQRDAATVRALAQYVRNQGSALTTYLEALTQMDPFYYVHHVSTTRP